MKRSRKNRSLKSSRSSCPDGNLIARVVGASVLVFRTVGEFLLVYSPDRANRPGGAKKPLPLGAWTPPEQDANDCRFGCQDSRHRSENFALSRREPDLIATAKNFCWAFFDNIFAIFPRFQLICVQRHDGDLAHSPQDLDDNTLADFLELCHTFPARIGFFNSWRAGATVDHLHFQWILRLPFNNIPIMTAGATTYRGFPLTSNWPANGVRFPFPLSDADTSRLFELIRFLKKERLPFNLVKVDGIVFVFPRNEAHAIVAAQPYGVMAALELVGILVCQTASLMQELDAHTVISSLSQTTLSQGDIERIIDRLDEMKLARSERTDNPPVIRVYVLAGGAASRLWPMTGATTPKCLLQSAEGSSLLAAALQRILPLTTGQLPATVVTQSEFAPAIRANLEINYELLDQPEKRDTAAAVSMAVRHAKSSGSLDDVVIVLPSDHDDVDEGGFNRATSLAVTVARRHRQSLVVIGVQTAEPKPGVGYIVPGCSLDDKATVCQVARFREKPPHDEAQVLVSEGALINTGIIVATVGCLCDALSKHVPAVWLPISAAESDEELAAAYSKIPSLSFDSSVTQAHESVIVVNGDFTFSDIGSWDAYMKRVVPDESENRVHGEHAGLDTTGCLIHVDGSTRVATIGVRDLLIVVNQNGVLVADKSLAQEVKRLAIS